MIKPTVKFQCERHRGKSTYAWTEERVLDPKDKRRCLAEAGDTRQRCYSTWSSQRQGAISVRQRAWHVSSPEEGSGKAGAGPQVIQHCWNIHRAVDVGELGAVRVEGMVGKGRGIFCSAFEVRVLTFFCM